MSPARVPLEPVSSYSPLAMRARICLEWPLVSTEVHGYYSNSRDTSRVVGVLAKVQGCEQHINVPCRSPIPVVTSLAARDTIPGMSVSRRLHKASRYNFACSNSFYKLPGWLVSAPRRSAPTCSTAALKPVSILSKVCCSHSLRVHARFAKE